MENYRLSNLRLLEAESIHIFREVAAVFENPVLLYSVGKDSSVLVHLARKAFAPGRIPFPLMHVDTGFKFPEMYEFRDRFLKEVGADIRGPRNGQAVADQANPWDLGTQRCCAALKTGGLVGGLGKGEYDAAIGGARRDEEKSRAKERVYSFRDQNGQWDPKNQRPELWNLFNGRIDKGESIRVFPLSNWTELDIWMYIHLEEIPIVPLYLAAEREMYVHGETLIPAHLTHPSFKPDSAPEKVMCRYRSLGCMPCTGAIRSEASSIPEVVQEMMVLRQSERSGRVIDHDVDGSMEQKKREGYF